MKIYGDEISTQFKTHIQEPGIIYGHNDVLAAEEQTHHRITHSFFSATDKWITVQPKLYIHIPRTFWSSFTRIVREYYLPWRWKVAYLDREDGTLPQRILVCTSVRDGKLSERLKTVIGKSLFVTHLINMNRYKELFGQEYLKIPRENSRHENRIVHPLGKCAGFYIESNSSDELCHIYRIRGVFSLLKYFLLKAFSSKWEEVAIQAGQISENVLIKRSERMTISKSCLIQPLQPKH